MVMAQAESKMTVAKAIALWKMNSGVITIDGELDLQYKKVAINKMVLTLSK
jgi:hypothetical protein